MAKNRSEMIIQEKQKELVASTSAKNRIHEWNDQNRKLIDMFKNDTSDTQNFMALVSSLDTFERKFKSEFEIDLSNIEDEKKVDETNWLNFFSKYPTDENHMLSIGIQVDLLKTELKEYIKLRSIINDYWNTYEFQPYKEAFNALKECAPQTYDTELKNFENTLGKMIRKQYKGTYSDIQKRYVQKMNQHLRNAFLSPVNRENELANAKKYLDMARIFTEKFDLEPPENYLGINDISVLINTLREKLPELKFDNTSEDEGLDEDLHALLNESQTISGAIDNIVNNAVSHYELVSGGLWSSDERRLPEDELIASAESQEMNWLSRDLEKDQPNSQFLNFEKAESVRFIENALNDISQSLWVLVKLIPGDEDIQDGAVVSLQIMFKKRFVKALLNVGTQVLIAKAKILDDKKLTEQDLQNLVNLTLFITEDINNKLEMIHKSFTPGLDNHTNNQMLIQDKNSSHESVRKYIEIADKISNTSIEMFAQRQEELSGYIERFIKGEKGSENDFIALKNKIGILLALPFAAGYKNNDKLLTSVKNLEKHIEDLLRRAITSTKVDETHKFIVNAANTYKLLNELPLKEKRVFKIETTLLDALKFRLDNIITELLKGEKLDTKLLGTFIDILDQARNSKLFPEDKLQELEQDFVQKIISAKKVVVYQTYFNKNKITHLATALKNRRDEILGVEKIVKLNGDETPDKIKELISAQITNDLKNNILITLPEDESLTSKVLDSINILMTNNPFLMVTLQTEDLTEKPSAGFAQKLKNQAQQLVNQNRAKTLEELNNRRLATLERIEDLLAGKLLSSKEFETKIQSLDGGLSNKEKGLLKTIYFQRALLSKKDLKANEILTFMKDHIPNLTEDDKQTTQLEFMLTANNHNTQQVFLTLAKHYEDKVPPLALAYYNGISEDSAYYPEALKARLRLETVPNDRYRLAERLLLKYGSNPDNLELALKAALDQNNDIETLKNFVGMFTLYKAESALFEIFKIVIAKNITSYQDLSHLLVGAYPQVLDKDNTLKVKYLESMVKQPESDLSRLTGITLSAQISILLKDPSILKSSATPLTARLKLISDKGALTQETLIDLMRYGFQQIELTPDNLQLFLSAVDKLSKFSNEWSLDKNEGLVREMFNGFRVLAMNNPEHTLELITALVKALPNDLQKSMRDNDPDVYRMMKPIRDLLKTTQPPRKLLDEYKVLAKMQPHERTRMVLMRAPRDLTTLVQENPASRFANKLMTTLKSKVTFDDSSSEDEGSEKASLDDDEFILVQADSAGSSSSQTIQSFIKNAEKQIEQLQYSAKTIQDTIQLSKRALDTLKKLRDQASSFSPKSEDTKNQIEQLNKQINERIIKVVDEQFFAIESYFKHKLEKSNDEYKSGNILTKHSTKSQFERNTKRASNMFEMITKLLSKGSDQDFINYFTDWQKINLSETQVSSQSGLKTLTTSFRKKVEQSTHSHFQENLDARSLLEMKKTPEGEERIKNFQSFLVQASNAKIGQEPIFYTASSSSSSKRKNTLD